VIDVATLSVTRRSALREQMSIRENFRSTGLVRNTVKKYLRAGDEQPRYASLSMVRDTTVSMREDARTRHRQAAVPGTEARIDCIGLLSGVRRHRIAKRSKRCAAPVCRI
jgi:hypothetical protein